MSRAVALGLAEFIVQRVDLGIERRDASFDLLLFGRELADLIAETLDGHFRVGRLPLQEAIVVSGQAKPLRS